MRSCTTLVGSQQYYPLTTKSVRAAYMTAPLFSMTIPSLALLRFLKPASTYQLRRADGSLVHSSIPDDHARHLAEKGVVYAKGSPSGKLRYLVLTVPEADADIIISRGAALAGRSVPGRIETMASRTVQRETVYCNDTAFRSFRHIRGDFFAHGAQRLYPTATKVA